MKRLMLLLCLALPLFACAQQADTSNRDNPLVLASLAPVYQLTRPLLAGTDIELRLLPDSPRSMQSHTTLFVRRAEQFAADFEAADAVISIGSVWPEDPFYISAREINIRVINIDAGKPYSHELDGVSIATVPGSDTVSPYFWLSPANVVRMLDTIGLDLQRLYPDAAATIAANLEREKTRYRRMKADAELALLAAADPVLYALADEFIYLTRDLTLFVDGYFIKQDIDWTEADADALTRHLREADIRVVIHQWEPNALIRDAVEAAGATLVVLDTLETTDDFAAGLQRNLDRLEAAFAP